MILLRPLPSTGISRFIATMSRSDFRPSPPAALWLVRRRWACNHPRNAGSPRFPCRSVPTRRPQSPRKARRVRTPVASPSVAGFSSSGETGRSRLWCNQVESGSLALQLAGSPPKASPVGLLLPALGRLPVERAIDRVTSFQITRSARLPWRTRGHREKTMQNQGQRRVSLFIMPSVGSVPRWFVFYFFCRSQ